MKSFPNVIDIYFFFYSLWCFHFLTLSCFAFTKFQTEICFTLQLSDSCWYFYSNTKPTQAHFQRSVHLLDQCLQKSFWRWCIGTSGWCQFSPNVPKTSSFRVHIMVTRFTERTQSCSLPAPPARFCFATTSYCDDVADFDLFSLLEESLTNMKYPLSTILRYLCLKQLV